MRRITVMLLTIELIFFLLGLTVVAQEKATAEKAAPAVVVHKYVGSQGCKMCHNSPAQGEQYNKWAASPHSKAFDILATPNALEVGKKLGIDKPQESAKCLVCHETGFSAPADQKQASFKPTEGVGCEVCHGPGSDYMAMKVMRDKTAAIAAGLVIPDEKVCVGCHNEKSPTYKKFVFADAVKIIAHPIPNKTPESAVPEAK
jgi:nitrate/TMAO reductase-like tetraheme cytochrome c subunit